MRGAGVRRSLGALAGAAVFALLATSPPSASAARAYSYDTPVMKSSPWPAMRRDRRNTGSSPLRAKFDPGARPWRFRTGKGVFSTPVLDGGDTAYFGSADRRFYAVDRNGDLRWKLKTGEIIDSAATLGGHDSLAGGPTVTVPSADEHIYRLRDPGKAGLSRKQRVVWRFHTDKPPVGGQIVNWWEGNVVTGPGGVLYAGNTGGGLYAIDRAGHELWNYPTGNAVWSAAAVDDAGRLFFGSVDAFLYGIDSAGAGLWSKLTIGFNAASAAIGSDGTVYIGSFDGKLYALDPATGAVRWQFATADHIYSSAALEQNEQGETVAIYAASADGSIYKLRPDGSVVWSYDTGDAIRSSPALGRAPEGEKGRILYVGSSDGRLYAIDTTDGSRRWSYDTTPNGAKLADRNDLNGSPALGKRGIWIGGEDGSMHFIPYDYCLGPGGRGDERCETDPGERFGDDLVRTFPVTAGGSIAQDGYPRPLPSATTLTARLVVRSDGVTQRAEMVPGADAASLVRSVKPAFDFSAQLSADGRNLHIVPEGFLKPGTKYRVRLAGAYDGEVQGSFDDTISFRTEQGGGTVPLDTGRDRVGAFDLRRLALPLPTLLPSVNQIGFDSYDWIAGTLDRTGSAKQGHGKLLLWVIGSREDSHGRRIADPASEFAFPLSGRWDGDDVILSQRGFELLFTFGPVPLEELAFRGALGADGIVGPGATVYGQVDCPSVPGLGGPLLAAGLCNDEKKLIAAGTYLTDGYKGPANRRPKDVSVRSVDLVRPTAGSDGSVSVRLEAGSGANFGPHRHTADVMLVDRATGAPLPLDYNGLSDVRVKNGKIAGVELTLPAGTELPAQLDAWVIADVFPLAQRRLDG